MLKAYTSATNILSILAILALLRQTGLGNFPAIFISVLDFYQDAVEFTFGWMTPIIQSYLSSILTMFQIDAILSSIWPHVTLLTGLYLLRNAARLLSAGRTAASLFQFLVSIFLMISIGVGAGLIDHNFNSEWSNIVVAAAPAIGTMLMGVCQGVWFAYNPSDRPYRTWPDFGGTPIYFIVQQTKYALGQFFAGLIFIVIVLQAQVVAESKSPQIIAMMSWVVYLAMYWIATAFVAVWNDPEGDFSARFLKHPAAIVGKSIFQIVLGVVGALFVSVGMNYFGS